MVGLAVDINSAVALDHFNAAKPINNQLKASHCGSSGSEISSACSVTQLKVYSFVTIRRLIPNTYTHETKLRRDGDSILYNLLWKITRVAVSNHTRR